MKACALGDVKIIPRISENKWKKGLYAVSRIIGNGLPGGSEFMKADEETAREILEAIDEAAQAFRERDIDRFMDIYAPDPDVIIIGTGKDEKCVGREEIKRTIERAWSQSDSAYFKIGWRSISSAGNVAWVAADATVHVEIKGRVLVEDLRFTFVYEKRGDRWLIVHSHDSLPAAGQEEGESFAITQMRESSPSRDQG
jgi:uncharacterized protein (TIGR02246 family)